MSDEPSFHLRTGRHHDIVVPIPPHGWRNPNVMNGRVLPLRLDRLRENELLRERGRGALRPLGVGPTGVDRRRPVLILIHGIDGDPVNMQPLVDGFVQSRFQLYILCYDDHGRRTKKNGDDLARELVTLRQQFTASREVAIVGHSLGGIVTRRALNTLCLGGQLGLFSRVRFLAVDTPWHGYPGPSDSGIEGFFMDLARPFMADGYEDMRAGSTMFQGDPGARNSADRRGLGDVDLPEHVEQHLVFARAGDVAQDYLEDMRPLLEQLVRHFREAHPIEGSSQLLNFYKALRGSAAWPGIGNFSRTLAAQGRLTPDTMLQQLLVHFPRFAGGHTAVLRDAELLAHTRRLFG